MAITDPQLTEKYLSGAKYKTRRDSDPADDVDASGNDNATVDFESDDEIIRGNVRNSENAQKCFKCSVRLSTTAVLGGITYTATTGRGNKGKITDAPDTIDGITLVADDRILVKDEAAGAGAVANGLYVVNTLGTGSDGIWIRVKDFFNTTHARCGLLVAVCEGTTNADTVWMLTSPEGAIIIGGASGSSLIFSKVAGVNPLLADGSQPLAGDLDLNGNKIVNLAAPSAANDAARKADVDAISTGLSWKAPVKTSTTGNITLSGEQTLDGVLTSTNRVLVKDQTLGEENGIYVSAAGAWARSTDADAGPELVSAAVFVEGGTTQADTAWVQTTDGPITPDTTVLVIVQFAGAGAVSGGGGVYVSNFGSPVNTGSIAAGGGTADFNMTDFGERATQVISLKVTPSAAISGYDIDIFRTDAFSGTSHYRAENITEGVTPFEDFGFAVLDDDATGELHVRVTNNDGSLAASFDIEVEGSTVVA